MSFIKHLFKSKKQATKPEFEFIAHKKDGFNKLGVKDLVNENDFLYSRGSNGSIKKWSKRDRSLVKNFEKPEYVKDSIANLVIDDNYLFSGHIKRTKLGPLSFGAGPNNILVYDVNGNLLYEIKHEKYSNETGYERLEYIFIKNSYIYGIFNSEWAIGDDTSGFDYVRITVWNHKGQQVNDYKFINCPPSTFTNDNDFIYALNQSQTGSKFGLHIFEYNKGEIIEKSVITSIKPESSGIKLGNSIYNYDKIVVDDINIYHLANKKLKCLDKKHFDINWELNEKFGRIFSACIHDKYFCFSSDSSIKIVKKDNGQIFKEIISKSHSLS